MKYTTHDIAVRLKAGREAKQLTQREFSARAGVPQAHISKIESGTVDLRLSSLVELGRVLNLELMLVPRKLVPAVEAIVRGGSGTSATIEQSRAQRELQKLRNAISHLQPASTASPEELHLLQRVVHELANFRLGAREAEQIHKTRAVVKRLEKHPESASRLMAATRKLQTLRNRLVHKISEPEVEPRPAYALDDDEDDDA
jgi:transcriptional regulator with XRE-family HTH domain